MSWLRKSQSALVGRFHRSCSSRSLTVVGHSWRRIKFRRSFSWSAQFPSIILARCAAMRNVIVTGGSRGLGLAIGCALCEAGYRVIAIARNKSAEFAAVGQDDLVFHSHALSEIDRLRTMVEQIRREYGAIYGLINNAGI